jgi:GT2 family glycosyltransferase
MGKSILRVSVVVLNYNGERILADCLESLRNQDFPNLEVIVVDNHSQDRSLELIRSRFPEVRLLALTENTGYCAGNHTGVQAAHGEYVALVNNDTVLPPDFIRSLAQALDQYPQAWVAAPHIHNRNLDMNAYPRTGTLGITGLVIQNVFHDPATIFGAPGAALMFRKAAVGMPFDSDYQFFHEDVYLSWRTWLAGHDVIFCPKVVVDHVGSASFRVQSSWYQWLLERNRLLNLFTFFSLGTVARLAPWWCLMLVLEHVLDLMSARSPVPRWKAYFWLLAHPRLIWNKRQALQAQRQVPDSRILRLMSCRVTNVGNLFGRTLNRVSRFWCWTMGIRTYEFGAAVPSVREDR